MRKFVLIVTYGTGKVCMECDTPDIIVALTDFKQRMIEQMGGMNDKGGYIPEIKSAEILPLLYESIYTKENKNG